MSDQPLQAIDSGVNAGATEVLRPTFVEIDLSTITNNFNVLKQRIGNAKLLAVIKANAYGHGLVPMAKHYESIGADYLGVAVLEEAMSLRHAGIRLPILVMGGVLNAQMKEFIRNDVSIAASSVDKLKQIDQAAGQLGLRARVHLKIDTGMGRIGVRFDRAQSLINAAAETKHCDVAGVFMHFSGSDQEDLSFARLQLNRFLDVCEQLETTFAKANRPMPLRHAANTGAIFNLPEAHLDMVRPGIGLVGCYPSEHVQHNNQLKIALTWKTRIVYFKVHPANQPVGYGSLWQSDQDEHVVTLPVGYGDGYFRRMTGRAEVLINGKRYPVVGRICMDQMMVCIGKDSAYNGDEVVLLGQSNDQRLSAEQLSEWADTSNYEIMTNISARVPRIYQ